MWLWAEAIACYSLCTGAAEARVEAVNGGIVDGVTGNDVTKQVYKELEPLRKELPAGMSIEVGLSLIHI